MNPQQPSQRPRIARAGPRLALVGLAVGSALLLAPAPSSNSAAGGPLAAYLQPLDGTRSYSRATWEENRWVADPNAITQTTLPLAQATTKRTPKLLKGRRDLHFRTWARAAGPDQAKHHWVGDRTEWLRFDEATDSLQWLAMRIPSRKQGKAPTGMVRWWGRALEDYELLPGSILATRPNGAPVKRAHRIRVDPEVRIVGLKVGNRNSNVEDEIVRLPDEAVSGYGRCVKIRMRFRSRGEDHTRTMWLARGHGIVRQEVHNDLGRERFTLRDG